MAVLVLDDRVRPAELWGELLVLGQLLEQPADVPVDLVRVFEVSHGRKSMPAPAPAGSARPCRRGRGRPTARCPSCPGRPRGSPNRGTPTPPPVDAAHGP